MKKRETPEWVMLLTTVPVRRLKAVTVNHIQGMIDAFGTALGLTVGTEAQPLVEIQQGIPNEDIAIALEKFQSLPDDLGLSVHIKIDKQHILAQIIPYPNQYNVLFYLFLDNVKDLLNASLPKLDQRLFTDVHTPTVILVSDAEVECCGALLTVISASKVECLESILAPPSARLKQRVDIRVDMFRQVASDSLNWVGFHLDHITPCHFICKCTQVEEPAAALANILVNRLLQLTVVYTANRSSIDGQQITALYASSEQSTAITLLDTTLETGLHENLVKLIAWLQTAGGTDKLTIFQNVIAREIPEDGPTDNFRAFVGRLSSLLRETRWQYRVYLDGKINKHFEQLQSVSSYITEIAREISQKLDSMTKGFVDTLLASVGVVILTLLASLVENKTEGVIFRVGMWTYAVYLLLFQVFYRMGHLFYSYSLVVEESDQRILPFRVALGGKKVTELTTILEKCKKQFKRMYWITIALYILVILVISASGSLLPSVISQLGGGVSTPVPALESPIPPPTQP
ncbi:MAG: hypothetical protein SXV54_19270 [Chloroflexota bacterium]|nr:hypothetical protein [Chloroflexota bacterium]